MKIRIKDNSVRLRLAKDEVSNLVNNEKVWSKCLFPNASFEYGLIAAEQEEITAEFSQNRVTIKVPHTLLKNWDTDNRVGFEHKGNQLNILIEKDWQCLKPRANEDESMLYQHPQSHQTK